MEKLNLWNKIISKVVVASTMIWIYLPIIGGIITPMVWLLPMMYYSWYLFGYPSWFSGILLVHRAVQNTIVVFESFLFSLGLYLLVAGIIHLAKARKARINVVSSGPYKYIRHPQHLGIILISIPFAFIFWNIGHQCIRLSDILSFLLNTTILMIISKIEEVKMKQRFPEEYSVYTQQAGFLFPKLRRKVDSEKKEYSEKTKKQLLLNYFGIITIYLVGYIVFVVITFLIVKYTTWFQFIYTR